MISLPKSVDPEELLINIRELSWEVSKILNSYNQISVDKDKFRKKLKIQNLKTGPVTSADIEVSELIKRRISNKYESISWEYLSEEDKKYIYNKNFKSKWVWIIDPLDGTKDFINNTGEYAMHLALTYEKKVIIGVVLIPSKNQLWIFFKGKGTWCENLNSSENISINKNSKEMNEIKILTSKSHMNKELSFLLEKLKPKEIIGMGSIGYKVASILRGEADLYISYSLPKGSCPKDWDIAAPLSLIEGAGGHFTDISGGNLEFLKERNYDQGGILIASININHMKICQEISNIIKNNN